MTKKTKIKKLEEVIEKLNEVGCEMELEWELDTLTEIVDSLKELIDYIKEVEEND